MSAPKWQVSFKPFKNSILTQILIKETGDIVYEFIDMSEHQALITVKDWVRQQKDTGTDGNV